MTLLSWLDVSTGTNAIALISFWIGLLGLAVFFSLPPPSAKKKKNRLLAANAQPPKSLIVCDGCAHVGSSSSSSTSSPSMRCGKCHCVYYCSQDCQKRHWKYHKKDCQSVQDKLVLLYNNNDNDNTTSSSSNSKDKKKACPICETEEPQMVHPVTLSNCGHVFCVPCLQRYQDLHQPPMITENDKIKCPCCRTTTTSTTTSRDTLLSKALLYTARASCHWQTNNTKDDDHDDDKKVEAACQLALLQLQQLESPTCDQDTLQANYIASQIATVRGDYKQAMLIVEQNLRIWQSGVERKKQVDALMKQGRVLSESSSETSKNNKNNNKTTDDESDDDEGAIDETTYQKMQQVQNQILEIMNQGSLLALETDLIECRLQMLDILTHQQDWDTAESLYQQLMTDYPKQSQLTPRQQRRVFMGFSRCLYEHGNYQGAINLGQAALDTQQHNRHTPGIHQYVALSHQQLGQLEQAQAVMGRAVLYEGHDDPIHQQQVYALWRKLMEE
ncbi:expressed unknown protein [Seminavis robusta]|uniref:Uncharacterized protein n=1 Tax=Seminavis robusta TaxID=568900 RepID=A0A9N8DTR8_9STRA|nr:expressed unknown protein [Seminavis robusta]|eukprot:Sro283_g107750.1 n/a (501) ;mRNA; r:45114-46616